jgi:hypothetical protein
LGAATTIVNAKVFDATKSQDWTSIQFADGLITKCSVAQDSPVIGGGRASEDGSFSLKPG